MIACNKKALILCADDYSQNEAICNGILLLAKKNRLNGISCLTNSDIWPDTAKALVSLQTTHFIGLHLNFTLGKPLSKQWQKSYGDKFNSHLILLKQCYLGKLDPYIIEAEVKAQIAAFNQSIGANPDFIDGHQHVHQLPVIRDVLIKLYQSQSVTDFFRQTCNGVSDFFSGKSFPKQSLIALLGGYAFKRRLGQHSIKTNTSFAGIYNFNKSGNYRDFFNEFLSKSRHEGLIMCHPGAESNDKSDPLYKNRVREFDYLNSDKFIQDLHAKNFYLIFSK